MDIRATVQKISSLIEDSKHARVKTDWIVWWLSDGQREVAKRTHCLRSSKDDTSVADQATYDLPTRFIRIDAVYYNTNLINPTTREQKDRDDQDFNSDPDNTSTSWESSTGNVSEWVHDIHANKLRLVMVPAVKDIAIKTLFSYMPAEFTKINATTVIPDYAEHAMFLFALNMAQKKLAISYDTDKELRQAQIWRQHSITSERNYENQIAEISAIIQNVQATYIPTQQGVGMEYSEDHYF